MKEWINQRQAGDRRQGEITDIWMYQEEERTMRAISLVSMVNLRVLRLRNAAIRYLDVRQCCKLLVVDIGATKVRHLNTRLNALISKLYLDWCDVSFLSFSCLRQLRILNTHHCGSIKYSLAAFEFAEEICCDNSQTIDSNGELAIMESNSDGPFFSSVAAIMDTSENYLEDRVLLECGQRQQIDTRNLMHCKELCLENLQGTALGDCYLQELERLECENVKIKCLQCQWLLQIKELRVSKSEVQHLDCSKIDSLVSLDITESGVRHINLSGLYKLVFLDLSNTDVRFIATEKLFSLQTLLIQNTRISFAPLADTERLSNLNVQRCSIITDLQKHRRIQQYSFSHNFTLNYLLFNCDTLEKLVIHSVEFAVMDICRLGRLRFLKVLSSTLGDFLSSTVNCVEQVQFQYSKISQISFANFINLHYFQCTHCEVSALDLRECVRLKHVKVSQAEEVLVSGDILVERD